MELFKNKPVQCHWKQNRVIFMKEVQTMNGGNYEVWMTKPYIWKTYLCAEERKFRITKFQNQKSRKAVHSTNSTLSNRPRTRSPISKIAFFKFFPKIVLHSKTFHANVSINNSIEYFRFQRILIRIKCMSNSSLIFQLRVKSFLTRSKL